MGHGSKDRFIRKALLVLSLVLLCGALALCWVAGSRHERGTAPMESGQPLTTEEVDSLFPRLATTAADRTTDGTDAREIDLTAQPEDTVLITEGGVYRLSGELNGRIRIAAEEQTVHLILDNCTVTSREGPALYVESAGKVILTLAEGSLNIFGDSGHYLKVEDAEACIFSDADLTFNGTGALTVNGLYKDAIRSRNVVKILDGNITIKCKRSGVHGTDGILVAGGSLNISSEKYGLRTTKSGTDGRGNLIVMGGEHWIIAGKHAFLTGRADLYVSGCVIHDRSIVSTSNVGGRTSIQSGCVQ